MLAKVHSAAVLGINSYTIEIEVNSGWGQPQVIIVGLPDAAVKESRDRVKRASYQFMEIADSVTAGQIPPEGFLVNMLGFLIFFGV